MDNTSSGVSGDAGVLAPAPKHPTPLDDYDRPLWDEPPTFDDEEIEAALY